MIITVTPNPSLDRAFDLASLEVGEVNRAIGVHVHAGGKGINVSRALSRQGIATLAVLPVGGPDGAQLLDELAAQEVPTHAVPISGATRSNVTLVDGAGVTTKVNAPGPGLTPHEVDALLEAIDAELVRGPRWVVAAGSLPEGAPDLFARLLEVARRRGVRLALDTSGAPLRDATRAGGIGVAKPNDEELSELVGSRLETVGEVRDAAHELIAAGTASVLVSLGVHGALLVEKGGCWWAGAPALVPLSTVGAGDVTLAGYLAVEGPGPDRLRRAVAWGRAAVLLPGSDVPHPSQTELAAVTVVDSPDPHTPLKEL
ncbi:1-phosphofructokinase family hexose kinase [Actinotalea sp. K2]|uniref:1-phosphofructokinase family hexose kinase n=1 Tax=Actinotalea sp. K2 TaxID=2939438 RepID=UPI002017C122|nr:1-phosphofructokinase family hexose kinase [Actinotalea sp. K2]MCL3859959.1 1-phosphofructokinase family hexose kinase [Actinotalea sp. K2]